MSSLDISRIRKNSAIGAKKGLKSSIWILKLLVPLSLLAVLLEWFGVVEMLAPVFRPVMSLINLPAEAFFPLVAGVLADVYGSVAVMAVMEFSVAQKVLIILFTAISHSLIVEGIIQWRSGINFFKITAIRLFASVIVVWAASLFYPATGESVAAVDTIAMASFGQVLFDWLKNISLLSVQIVLVVTFILVLQEIAMSYGIIEKARIVFSPLMRFMGLSDQAMVPWLVAIFGGVTIGSAVIIEECRRGAISSVELQYFHASIGINHSMIEHSAALSTIVGSGIPVVIIVRFVAAVLVAHGMRFWDKLAKIELFQARRKA
ncbi:MAG: hypothetical protein PHX97_02550 [Dehalococcoidales bacterium]|nr:hypothetical protein [Dehalococcoidales bacterium]